MMESSADHMDAKEMHTFDAYTTFYVCLTLIVCVLVSYYIKHNRIYFLPESAGMMLVGVVIGGISTLYVDNLNLYKLNPEIFFFIYLPPIIFEAAYSLDRKLFFDNIGAIALYAMIGTIMNCFIIAYLTLLIGQSGIITSIDAKNPVEVLLFGALVSAVDPVATLSIMGSPELECNKTAYTLVFGESVLNDAIAMVLYRTFRKYYTPDGENFSASDLSTCFVEFFTVAGLSILLGCALGLVASFIYKHSEIEKFPNYEAALQLFFCYLCYALAEAIDLSGIMATFFNGLLLSHYNLHNLNKVAHEGSEFLFGTLVVVFETVTFLYMGFTTFTGEFQNWDKKFSAFAILFCLFGRAMSVFPLTYLANQCRRHGENYIPMRMQAIMWLAGLRGAIAFALSLEFPGPNSGTYASATLTIVFFTTFINGGLTNTALEMTGLKKGAFKGSQGDMMSGSGHSNLIGGHKYVQDMKQNVNNSFTRFWTNIDNRFLIPYFGGSVYDEIKNGNDHGSGYGAVSREELGA